MASKATSKLLKKLGKKDWKKARSATVTPRGSALPAGIIRGVARVTGWKIDEDKNGDPYIFINLVVCSPETSKDVKAQAQYFIHETKTKTAEQKLAELTSDLKLLGCDLDGTTEKDLPKILKKLKKDAPYLYFNTVSYGTGDPMLFIQKLAKDYEEDEASDDEDEEEDSDEDESEDEDEDDKDDDSDDEDEDESDDEDDEDEDEDEDEEEEEDAPWIPAKDDIYLYKPPKKKKGVEARGTKVSEKKKTVSLKEEGGKKVWKDVSWTKLKSAE